MTKKDYELIAFPVKATKIAVERDRTEDPLAYLVEVLTKRLKADNHNFTRQKFVDTCGSTLNVFTLEVTK